MNEIRKFQKDVDLTPIARLKVNPDRPLGIDLKKMLCKMVDEATMRNERMVQDLKSKVRQEVYEAAKARLEVEGVAIMIAGHEAEIARLKKSLALRGWNIDASGPYTGHHYALPLSEHDSSIGKARGEEILRLAEEAEKRIIDYTTKVDKVKAKLLLSSTYGEALTIMSTVMGNGDRILEA